MRQSPILRRCSFQGQRQRRRQHKSSAALSSFHGSNLFSLSLSFSLALAMFVYLPCRCAARARVCACLAALKCIFFCLGKKESKAQGKQQEKELDKRKESVALRTQPLPASQPPLCFGSSGSAAAIATYFTFCRCLGMRSDRAVEEGG